MIHPRILSVHVLRPIHSTLLPVRALFICYKLPETLLTRLWINVNACENESKAFPFVNRIEIKLCNYWNAQLQLGALSNAKCKYFLLHLQRVFWWLTECRFVGLYLKSTYDRIKKPISRFPNQWIQQWYFPIGILMYKPTSAVPWRFNSVEHVNHAEDEYAWYNRSQRFTALILV